MTSEYGSSPVEQAALHILRFFPNLEIISGMKTLSISSLEEILATNLLTPNRISVTTSDEEGGDDGEEDDGGGGGGEKEEDEDVGDDEEGGGMVQHPFKVRFT